MSAPSPMKPRRSESKPAPTPSRRRPAKQPTLRTLSQVTPSVPARRHAAAILETLAGVRTPTEAAEALAVSLPRYYALEARALEGLIRACEPRAKGPRRTPEREVARLQKEVERLEREGARTQALLRAAQRAVGLAALRSPKGKSPSERVDRQKRRRRRPTARALRAVESLRKGEAENSVETPATGEDNAPQKRS
jgi:hypothetical protein